MGDDRVERRALLGASAGLLASLAGCSGLFIEPETTGTPGVASPTPTSTPEPTAAPTDQPTRTASPAPTAAPLLGDAIEVSNRQLSVRRSRLETFAFVSYRFDVENTGSRTIRDVEFRGRLRYERGDISRIVAVDYPRFRFDDEDRDDEDDDDGLDPDESERVTDEVRFERDGRAEESTDVDRFDIELSVRRIRFR